MFKLIGDMLKAVTLSTQNVLLYMIEPVVLATRSVRLLQVEFLLGLSSESWKVSTYVGYLEVFNDFSLWSVWQFLQVLTKNLHFIVGLFQFAFIAYSFGSLHWHRFSRSPQEKVVIGRLSPRFDGASLIWISLIHIRLWRGHRNDTTGWNFLYAVLPVTSSAATFSGFGGSCRCYRG